MDDSLIRITSKDAEVWDYRVRVVGYAEEDVASNMAIRVGERTVAFAPRRGHFKIEVPLGEGENVVWAVGRKEDGTEVQSNRVLFRVPLGRAAYGASLPPPEGPRPTGPARDVRLYGVCVHLLSDRGLKGVTEDLDRIKDLGCNAVWLNPTYPTARGGHGYDVSDYFSVRPEYGTLDDMRELVREAHARDMRVLLDLVPNHSSAGHPYFQDALEHGEHSHYRDFYLWENEKTPRHYFHWEYLPNLNYDHPEVRRMMVEAGRFWVGKVGIDGFRVDVAWGVLERRSGFWREWSEALRRIYPQVVLVAEASARWAEYFEEGYDAAYDWNNGFRPAWRNLFSDPQKAPAVLHRALNGGEKGFHPQGLVLRFVDNNDTGPRFYTQQGPERARLAAVLLCTLPGIPLVYMGQENGASYEPYGGMDPIEMGEDKDLEQLYRRLLSLRAREPALVGPHWERADAKTDVPAYAFFRTEPGGSRFLVVLNFGQERGTVEVDLKGAADGETEWTDLAFGIRGERRGGRIAVPVDGPGAAVFRLDGTGEVDE